MRSRFYTSCRNASKGIYYYTTYDNHQISAVDMHRTDLDSKTLSRYKPAMEEQIFLSELDAGGRAMSEERKIVGVNLGNWFVLEKWMRPFLFEENCAEDEVWLNRKVPAKKRVRDDEKNRDTYIEEVDFAKIAAHGINAGAPAGSVFRVRG